MFLIQVKFSCRRDKKIFLSEIDKYVETSTETI